MFKDSWLLFLAKGGGCNPVSWIKSWNEQEERQRSKLARTQFCYGQDRV